MIRVNYLREGERHRLSVTGHAGYAAHGNDIVCAGVSGISYALLGYLHNIGCDITKAHTDSGELLLDVRGDEMTTGAMDMALVGYLQIAKKYPQHVDVYIARTAG
jgi:uncharacterized protein YsxB (DUF464 family)